MKVTKLELRQNEADAKSGNNRYKIVGIGAGPANLSLASLLDSHSNISHIFVDQKKDFSWHDDQMIDNATLQVSIFKDLVTLSDPTNKYSFLSYLHEKGKIYHFINARFDEVPRKEFRNYMAWAAANNENVIFGEKVENISFNDYFYIQTNKRTLTAENISIGVGTQPWVPDFAVSNIGNTQFHVSTYMKNLIDLQGKSVAIVGGGQSGAEVFLDLISKKYGIGPSKITWLSRRQNYFPIDDSAFTNDFYMPCYSDYFNSLPPALREEATCSNLLTSDGISESILKAIYQKLYYRQFIDNDVDSFGLLPNRSVVDVTPNNEGKNNWQLIVNHNDGRKAEMINADIIIWATGYRPTGKSFLGDISSRIERVNDEFLIEGDFSVRWDGSSNRKIFVQNAARGQRGLPDVNLSLNAFRAQRIISSLTGLQEFEQNKSFIEWDSSLNDYSTLQPGKALRNIEPLKTFA